MRKETTITLLILTFSSLLSSGQLVWVEENLDNETGLRRGRIKGTFGPIPVFYLIEPKTVLRNLNDGPVSFLGFDLSNTDLNQANLMNARLIRTDLSGANLNQAVENILGNHREIDYKSIPAATFTHPEISSVGFSETEAKEESKAMRDFNS